MSETAKMPTTPDGRYFVVRGRLWRCTRPGLGAEEKALLVKKLMDGRRAKGTAMQAGDEAGRRAAMGEIEAAKVGLGERGAVWWTDGAPDWNRHLVKNSPYAEWFAGLG